MRITKKFVTLLFYFIILSSMNLEIVEGVINYGALIKNVYDKYMTKSLIITTARNYFSFKRIGILQKLSRELSAEGIQSLILNSMLLEKGMSRHSTESHRPLIVMFLDEVTELQKFSEVMLNLDMSYSQQLVIFSGNGDDDHCKYCRNPIGNSFHLKFNSKMLIVCCESKYIEEWWSKRRNQTSTMPRGEWIREADEVKWYLERNISTNRQSLDNKGFRIVTLEGSIFAWEKNNQVCGLFGSLLTELSQIMNFSIAHVTEKNSFGKWDSESSKWSGIMDSVVRGEADIGAAEFVMTPERMRDVDFTIPIFIFKRALLIKKPDNVAILWDACFKPFHGKTWMAITIFLLITPILLTIIKYTRKNNFIDMLCEHFLNVWGLLCQKPLPDFPDRIPLKMVYISIYVMAVVLYAAYSASFISYLTISSSYLPFHSLREFAEDGTYKLTVVKHATTHQSIEGSTDELLQKLKAKMLPINSLPLTHAEAIEQICIRKLAFYYADNLKYIHPPCEVVAIPIGGILNIAMILSLNGEYTEIINDHIRQFQRSGLMSRLENEYFTKKDVAETSYEPVTIEGITSILIIFTAGLSVAFAIFCIELP